MAAQGGRDSVVDQPDHLCPNHCRAMGGQGGADPGLSSDGTCQSTGTAGDYPGSVRFLLCQHRDLFHLLAGERTSQGDYSARLDFGGTGV